MSTLLAKMHILYSHEMLCMNAKIVQMQYLWKWMIDGVSFCKFIIHKKWLKSLYDMATVEKMCEEFGACAY
jgi:hypothetical protein